MLANFEVRPNFLDYFSPSNQFYRPIFTWGTKFWQIFTFNIKILANLTLITKIWTIYTLFWHFFTLKPKILTQNPMLTFKKPKMTFKTNHFDNEKTEFWHEIDFYCQAKKKKNAQLISADQAVSMTSSIRSDRDSTLAASSVEHEPRQWAGQRADVQPLRGRVGQQGREQRTELGLHLFGPRQERKYPIGIASWSGSGYFLLFLSSF